MPDIPSTAVVYPTPASLLLLQCAISAIPRRRRVRPSNRPSGSTNPHRLRTPFKIRRSRRANRRFNPSALEATLHRTTPMVNRASPQTGRSGACGPTPHGAGIRRTYDTPCPAAMHSSSTQQRQAYPLPSKLRGGPTGGWQPAELSTGITPDLGNYTASRAVASETGLTAAGLLHTVKRAGAAVIQSANGIRRPESNCYASGFNAR